MAAPTETARSTPGGIPLDDGFSTKIAFAGDPDISFWEKSLTPPEVDGGEPKEFTTMHNTAWRTMLPKKLKTLSPFTVKAFYDPDLYDQATARINVNDQGTVHFPDGSTLAFWGYIQKLTPQEHTEGVVPECELTIVPTNWDDGNNVEAAPVMTEVAGT
jgi:hypothetical protein